jgi:hypothetical protein
MAGGGDGAARHAAADWAPSAMRGRAIFRVDEHLRPATLRFREDGVSLKDELRRARWRWRGGTVAFIGLLDRRPIVGKRGIVATAPSAVFDTSTFR